MMRERINDVPIPREMLYYPLSSCQEDGLTAETSLTIKVFPVELATSMMPPLIIMHVDAHKFFFLWQAQRLYSQEVGYH